MSIYPTLPKKKFLGFCYGLSGKINYQKNAYLESQLDRLYQLYKICCQYLSPKNNILSIGAGSAYLESVLSLHHGIVVDVVDFPEMIEMNKVHYDHCGFKSISKNIIEVTEADIPHKHYDLILSSEVIEHLPESPSKHIDRFKEGLKAGGFFLISTPNLGRLSTILALLMMNPILPAPEKTFDIVSFDNEGVHRREYMPVEIEGALRTNGLSHMFTCYANKRTSKYWSKLILYSFAGLIPRFRTNLICMAKI
jgi:2-polyprenyl-3-methyl-5-hydroxy-6-metoxy-1,4-benzoquinol methylase